MADPQNQYTEEIRVKLDGGLNTRSSPLFVKEDQVVSVSNFRTLKRGSVELRDGAALLFTNEYPAAAIGNLTSNNRLPAPECSFTAGGSWPQPVTYAVKYFLPGWEGDIGASLPGSATSGANRNLKVLVKPLNLGNSAGQAAPAIDDPLMNGCSELTIPVYVQSGGAGDFYRQAPFDVAWSTTDIGYVVNFSAFLIIYGTIPADSVDGQAIVLLYYHEVADMGIVIAADRCFSFPTFQAVAGSNEWHIPTDVGNATYTSGRLYYLSRSAGAQRGIAEAGRVMVFCDGFRPKKSSIGDGSSTPFLVPYVYNRWVMLGANAPTTAPTLAEVVGGAAVFAAGDYYYRQTFIYRHSRAVDRNRTEYWYSESAPVTTAVLTSAAGADSFTVTFTSYTTETNLYKVRLYRTTVGGGVYYRVADIDPASADPTDTYSDTTPDASIIGRKTDPDNEGKVPLDCPPASLVHPFEARGRIWGFIGRVINVSSADLRVRAVLGGVVARCSKVQKITYPDPNGSDTETIEQSVDAWPDTDDYTVVCGGSGSVSAGIFHNGRIYVFKTTEIGMITGSIPGTFDYEVIHSDIGAIPNSLINVQGVLFFWNADKGPYQFLGGEYSWVGDDFQPDWKTDRDAGYWCSSVVHDRETNEVRWSFTDASVDPATVGTDEDDDRGSWKEYVYHTPSQSWWAWSGASRSREVKAVTNRLSQNLVNPMVGRQQVTFGDTSGRVMTDHGARKDITTTITGSLELRLFGYGEDFSWVKMFQHLHVLYEMGTPTSGTVTIAAKTSAGANYTTFMTLTATTTGIAMQIEDFKSPVNSTDNITQDRGVWVKVTSTIDTTFVINAIIAEYEKTQLRARSV